MGYTHYWEFKPIKRGDTKETNKRFNKTVEVCNKIIRRYNSELPKGHPERLSGYSAYTTSKEYGGIKFNGRAENAHEDFIIREHYRDNIGFNFCKTARKPYDEVVTACLIVLKHYLKDRIVVNSDGLFEEWIPGVRLANSVTGINYNIPDSIEGKEEFRSTLQLIIGDK